jgi:hypothetical protein
MFAWVPAFAGMTEWVGQTAHGTSASNNLQNAGIYDASIASLQGAEEFLLSLIVDAGSSIV